MTFITLMTVIYNIIMCIMMVSAVAFILLFLYAVGYAVWVLTSDR